MFGDFPVFQLRGVASYLNDSRAEKDIDLRIVVEDENDCPPVFNLTIGAVFELSERGMAIIHHTSETIMKLAYPGSLQTCSSTYISAKLWCSGIFPTQ